MTRPALLTAPLKTVVLALFPLLLGFFAAGDAHAHATGENYVWVNVESSHVEGRFEIRLVLVLVHPHRGTIGIVIQKTAFRRPRAFRNCLPNRVDFRRNSGPVGAAGMFLDISIPSPIREPAKPPC